MKKLFNYWLLIAALAFTGCARKKENPRELPPEAPVISKQPASVTIAEGGNATFSVEVTAPERNSITLSYQWQSATKGTTAFTDITGATSKSYNTPMLRNEQDGTQYRVVVTATNAANKTNITTSSVVTLTITPNPNRITFEPLTDATKTVIGMREFLLTVSFSDITTGAKDSLDFIVSESATALDYETRVKTNPARIRRTFTSVTNSRQIYFSVTDQVVVDTEGVPTLGTNTSIDATTKIITTTGKTTPETSAIIRAANPGFMIPLGQYYVHVYYAGKWVKASPMVQLLPAATSFEPVINTDIVKAGTYPKDANGNYRLEFHMFGGMKDFPEIEAKQGELYLYPHRLSKPLDETQDGSSGMCFVSPGNVSTHYLTLNDVSMTFSFPYWTPNSSNSISSNIYFAYDYGYGSTTWDMMVFLTKRAFVIPIGEKVEIRYDISCIPTDVNVLSFSSTRYIKVIAE